MTRVFVLLCAVAVCAATNPCAPANQEVEVNNVCVQCGSAAGEPVCATSYPAHLDSNHGCQINLKAVGGICTDCGATGEVPCDFNQMDSSTNVMWTKNDGCDSHRVMNPEEESCSVHCCFGSYDATSGACVQNTAHGNRLVIKHDTSTSQSLAAQSLAAQSLAAHINHRCYFDHDDVTSNQCKCMCHFTRECILCGHPNTPVCTGSPANIVVNGGCNKDLIPINNVCDSCGSSNEVPCNYNVMTNNALSVENDGCDSHRILHMASSLCIQCGHASDPPCNAGFPTSIDGNAGCNNGLTLTGGFCIYDI